MIPIIQNEAEMHKWLDTKQFTDIIAVSGMAPGPIATNSAVIVGFKLSNILGAVVACIAVTLPSLLLILIIGKLFIKFQQHPIVKAAFYGLRAAIIGIIAFAAVKFALGNGIIGGSNIIDIKSVLIMLAGFGLLLKTKIHPIIMIAASGIMGMVIF